MIYIDYQAGAHGNYLEFVCNKFLAGISCEKSPFNDLGAAHKRIYYADKIFSAKHYFQTAIDIKNSAVITIQIQPDDLLQLLSISLLRAGDYNYDNDQLEINTFNKLNNVHYRGMLDNIKNSYFSDSRVEGYLAIKHPSWPEVNSLKDFNLLPDRIRSECEQVFGLLPPQFSETTPDCPRHKLREFFKIGFKNPEISKFITEQKKMSYDASNQVYIFPYKVFYNLQEFQKEITNLGKFLGYTFDATTEFEQLHNEFLSKQPYVDIKQKCDYLFARILNEEIFDIPKLTLFEESYLDARLELYYNKPTVFNQKMWFPSSKKILEHFKS